MNLSLKTKEQNSKEDAENLLHGIVFEKAQKTECDDPSCKDRTSLQSEFSSADKGIEIEEPEKEPETLKSLDDTDKKTVEKEYIQKEDKNGVTILPNHESSDFPEEDDVPKNLRGLP
ncbi:MAG: hypothetical protein NTZ13_01280 [Candidatus Parcubacteria bacterium]|nr:hypothetical protein [Candidatus Parcubacteria bacterium]